MCEEGHVCENRDMCDEVGLCKEGDMCEEVGMCLGGLLADAPSLSSLGVAVAVGLWARCCQSATFHSRPCKLW